MGGTKLEKFLPKNQHTQKKLLNFENWINTLNYLINKQDGISEQGGIF